MSKYLSRKFIVVMLIIVVGSLALFMDKLSGSNFVALVGAVAGLYEAGQSFVDGMEKKNGKSS